MLLLLLICPDRVDRHRCFDRFVSALIILNHVADTGACSRAERCAAS